MSSIDFEPPPSAGRGYGAPRRSAPPIRRYRARSAQIDFRVGRRAAGPLAQKIVHRVFIVGRWRNVVAGVNAVDIRQENVAGWAGEMHVVLHVQRQLKIVAPVAASTPLSGTVGSSFKKIRRP